jgi:hypothetical protein
MRSKKKSQKKSSPTVIRLALQRLRARCSSGEPQRGRPNSDRQRPAAVSPPPEKQARRAPREVPAFAARATPVRANEKSEDLRAFFLSCSLSISPSFFAFYFYFFVAVFSFITLAS